MKAVLSSASRLIVVHFFLLLAPAIMDIVFLGFTAFTIVCFAVAGVFSGVFCYGEKATLQRVVGVLLTCTLLFFLVAPLSGSDYNLPVRSFAVTEALTTVFLWKNKFHNEAKKTIKTYYPPLKSKQQ